MQKILPGTEVKKLDELYIHAKGISSFDLMERAAGAFCTWFVSRFDAAQQVAVFSGTGNNGGDGLAISRMLFEMQYRVSLFIIGDTRQASPDFTRNLEILPELLPVKKGDVLQLDDLEAGVVIDAVFGVGINRPLQGIYAQLIQRLNRLNAVKVSVDIPSGLPSDKVADGESFLADHTVSFQFPKLSLLFPENAEYTGELTVLDIGIDESYSDSFPELAYFVQEHDIHVRHKTFHRFSHKGNFGKVMLIGGSYGKIGAIRLSAYAALRTGSGLVSCFVPRCGVNILQTALPEVMVEASAGELELEVGGMVNLSRFDALGIGPGMGTGKHAAACLQFVLGNYDKPLVLDADALNVLSDNRALLALLRENILLTPHLVEFERIVGKCKNHAERMFKAKDFCKKYRCIIILKGAHTLITTPDGRQFFNSSGTQYMATGGAGDVLTGILTSFLGQGYSPEDAAICGVYHHGLAGELASKSRLRSTIASDIVEYIPRTFVKLGIL